MTVETGRARRRGGASVVAGRPDEAAGRPAARESSASLPASAVTCARVGPQRYRVTRSGETLGFVDIEGGIFVALAGPRYDRAVEASQTLSLDDAVRALEDRRSSR